MRDLNEMTEFELEEIKERINRRLFDLSKHRRVMELKSEIDRVQGETIEEFISRKFEDEFDYTHR